MKSRWLSLLLVCMLAGCGGTNRPAAETAPPSSDGVPEITISAGSAATADPNAGEAPSPVATTQPAEQTQAIALAAPVRLTQGQRADVYLSFGPNASAVLPDTPGVQPQQGLITTPREGSVAPVLGFSGPLTITPVDVRPVSVTTKVAKRWQWTVVVAADANPEQPITLEPSMEYYAVGASSPEIIWPLQPLHVEIEVVPTNAWSRLQTALGSSANLLALLGLSYAAVGGWCWAFLRRIWPRLRGQAPSAVGSKTS